MANDIVEIKLYIYKRQPVSIENSGCIYELTAKIQSHSDVPTEIESFTIHELRNTLGQWALSWLENGCTISLKEKQFG